MTCTHTEAVVVVAVAAAVAEAAAGLGERKRDREREPYTRAGLREREREDQVYCGFCCTRTYTDTGSQAGRLLLFPHAFSSFRMHDGHIRGRLVRERDGEIRSQEKEESGERIASHPR